MGKRAGYAFRLTFPEYACSREFGSRPRSGRVDRAAQQAVVQTMRAHNCGTPPSWPSIHIGMNVSPVVAIAQ